MASMRLIDEADAPVFGEAVLATAGSPDAARRTEQMSELRDKNHPPEPCWYLNFMGDVPDRQGQGITAPLLRGRCSIRQTATGLPRT